MEIEIQPCRISESPQRGHHLRFKYCGSIEHAETLGNAKHQLLQEIITEGVDEGRSESCSASARVVDVKLHQEEEGVTSYREEDPNMPSIFILTSVVVEQLFYLTFMLIMLPNITQHLALCAQC